MNAPVRRIRILYFLNSLAFAGVEKHVADLINHLDNELFQPYLICPNEIVPQFKSHIGDDKAIIIPLRIRGIADLRDILLFLRLLRRIRPDIVNSHLYFASRFGSPLAKLMGTPVVIETAHIVERWRKGYKKFFLVWDIVSGLFVDKVISVSEAVKGYYVKYKKMPRSKIEVIHNWCELDKFSRDRYSNHFVKRKKENLGIPENYKVIGVVGRLEEQKGHKYLIKALPSIIEKFPNIAVFFVGEGSLKADLLNLSKRFGVSEKIKFLGFRNDIPELVSLMDVLVLPSLFEGLPLTAIEASAMGVPVVASRVDGTPDVIVDGETGFLVPPGDHEELADKILELLAEPKKAKQMGEKAQKFISKNFDSETQVKKTEELYLVALSTHKHFKKGSLLSLPSFPLFR